MLPHFVTTTCISFHVISTVLDNDKIGLTMVTVLVTWGGTVLHINIHAYHHILICLFPNMGLLSWKAAELKLVKICIKYSGLFLPVLISFYSLF